MVRTLGIDPGTKSMDVCGLENGEIYFEKQIDTQRVAKNPKLLIEVLEKAKPFDLITGPSGYGIEVTYLDEIKYKDLEDWYYNYILLTDKKKIRKAMDRNVLGAFLYYAMAESVKEMKRRDWPVCFIPGVINLPTVQEYKKVNKIDMGTADKLAVASLGVLNEHKNEDNSLDRISFVLIEMGFGYNSVIAVDRGRIVDGIGGTTINGPGFLSISSMDAELVQMVGDWSKEDVFLGGASSISGVDSPENLVACIEKEKSCSIAYNAMLEGVQKAVNSIKVSIPNNVKVLLSGRLTKIQRIKNDLRERLNEDVRYLNDLKNINRVKKTAQGYAIISDGLAKGKYEKLIEHMKIEQAEGTSIDYIYHPKALKAKENLVNFK